MKKIIVIGIIGILLIITPFSNALGGNIKSEETIHIDFPNCNENTSSINTQTEGACEGYTLINLLETFGGKAKLIDMNGDKKNVWFSIFPSVYSFPSKMLPGGEIIVGKIPTFLPYIINKLFGADAVHAFADNKYLVQMDWNGKILWSFNDWDNLKIFIFNFGKTARQHHDFQREGNPVGYYAPGQDFVPKGKTLILAHKDVLNTSISEKTLHDDVIYEVDWNGELTGFIWYANEHFDEFGFDEDAKESIWKYPGLDIPDVDWQKTAKLQGFGKGDWLSLNSVSRIGKNKWYDQDPITYSYLHPENLIIDSRHANFIAIIDHETGNIVWRLGPDYSDEMGNIGQIIGPHNAHIIPDGLPGAGNILVFDNGGAAGYGNVPGQPNKYRNYSRVIEFNPVTMEIVWNYSNVKSGKVDDIFIHHWLNITKGEDHHFYSPYVCSAQRLLNGNTLITEGFSKRVFEVNNKGELVWEFAPDTPKERSKIGIIYRAYRIPPEWTKNNPSGYAFWENN